MENKNSVSAGQDLATGSSEELAAQADGQSCVVELKERIHLLREALGGLAFSYDDRDQGDGCWCYTERNGETYFEQWGTHHPTCEAARSAYYAEPRTTERKEVSPESTLVSDSW